MPEGISVSEALIRDVTPLLINAPVIPYSMCVYPAPLLCVHLHELRLQRISTLQLEVTQPDYWPVGMLLWFVELQRPCFCSQGLFESRSSQCQ